MLTGRVNPSARLPVTLPRQVGQLPCITTCRARGDRSEIYGDYVDCESSPLFAFGHGLSYTTFEYRSLLVQGGTTATTTTVEVEVTNAGDRGRGGRAALRARRCRIGGSARAQLIGFAKVALGTRGDDHRDVPRAAGPARFHNRAMQRVTEPGTFTFFVGASSVDIRAEGTVELTGDTVSHAVRDSAMTSYRLSTP